jgi:hypothetical protein
MGHGFHSEGVNHHRLGYMRINPNRESEAWRKHLVGGIDGIGPALWCLSAGPRHGRDCGSMPALGDAISGSSSSCLKLEKWTAIQWNMPKCQTCINMGYFRYASKPVWPTDFWRQDWTHSSVGRHLCFPYVSPWNPHFWRPCTQPCGFQNRQK